MMDAKKLQYLVDMFFTCRRDELMQIFGEMLSALEAEQSMPPGRLMSRNYETAQANPEIHTLPGNLKDARDAIFPYYWGTDSWQSKLHLENVKGPPNFASLIGSIAALLKNPNLCVDTYCLRSNELEVKSITALANLIFYHTESPWGVFTIGGTISNLYGGKIGIEKVAPGTMQNGIGEKKLAGLVSEAGHYSNATLAGWLGIGVKNLHSIPTDENMSMRLDRLEQKLDELYSDGVKVAFVIATFGTTDAFGIDDIQSIKEIIDRKSQQYDVTPAHLHADAAVGWISCFLTEYNIQGNPLGANAETLKLIQRTQQATVGFRYADSVTLDFHKMGWGHYPSSAFIVRHRDDLLHLTRTLEEIPYFSEADFRHDPALFTLECSRPGIGPYAVMASLNGIGLNGYRCLVANAIDKANQLKRRIEELDFCKVLNLNTLGPSVCWWVLPRGRNAKALFKQLEDGTMSVEEQTQYFGEIKRLYNKRAATLDPAVDARLSFTTSIGYCPHGVQLPAWKAVFFNPKTDDEVIDRLIDSIKDLV
ncbi:pyridoxal phosphate-dependent decarboxylase family protein [Novipirellula sp. SH528]|uniref:pyridoxal phosphate-dependent decarboxylase family protein n=1 Tax=Novipirellula sp. SH528 TaxID=3454466 RepID=UPI003F9EC4B5